MRLFLPEYVNFLLDKLHQNGFLAYVVGGCVRDLLMGKKPHDYDVTTNALPNDVISLFEKTVPTGIKHGTVTVIIDHNPIEVTTFRTENGYGDSRHPDSVNFVKNLEFDLSRRDFTTNAIAYNHTEGIVDLFGGIDDINNGILRTVANPTMRFSEDALRILRLFRFASQLNFTPEEKTLESAVKLAPLLKKISCERIAIEFTKTVCGCNPNAILPLLECGGLSFLNLSAPVNLSAINSLPNKDKLRLYAFCLLCNANGNDFLKILKFSNAHKAYFSRLDMLFDLSPITSSQIKHALSCCDISDIENYTVLAKVLYNRDCDFVLVEANRILSENEPYKISHLAINGNDLLALGITGQKSGKILKSLLKKVIEQPSLNTKENLLTLIKKERNE